ncbi:MAG: tetratricopeptide repeat protein [Alphaproteobacteria bacterium]
MASPSASHLAALRRLFDEAARRRAAGDIAGALARYDRAIAIDPAFAEAHYNRGNLLAERGDDAGAVAAFERALAARTAFPLARFNLGNALMRLGRHADALAAFAAADGPGVDPYAVKLHVGIVLRQLGRVKEAEAAFLAAIAIRPDHPAARTMRAHVLADRREWDAAEAIYRAVTAEHPVAPPPWIGLANMALARGRVGEAIAAAERIAATSGDGAMCLGNARLAGGDAEGAVAAYETALALRPGHAGGHSNLLFALHHLPAIAPADLLAAHRAFAARHAAGLADGPAAVRDPRPNRPLRVGYVSPDFRDHPVAHFVLPLLVAHDRAAVESFAYADLARPDATTGQIRAAADHWRPITGRSDAEVADLVRADGIDVLVDLAGHTAHHRLLCFARRPAPVQATWLGYPGTTGLDVFDARLVDAATDPPGAEAQASEPLWRLPGPFLCYASTAGAPAAGPRPAGGPVTFASFNNPTKLNLALVARWAEILAAVPDARLLLKGRTFDDPSVADRWREAFARQRIAAGRIELRGWSPTTTSHLGVYGEVDVALDNFPYNGTTTTCEALWMGAPVVALAGDRHSARVGASLLAACGLERLVAADGRAYVARAVRLAGDPDLRARLRAGLRDRMAASALMSGPRFARAVEAAYRALWQRRCAA